MEKLKPIDRQKVYRMEKRVIAFLRLETWNLKLLRKRLNLNGRACRIGAELENVELTMEGHQAISRFQIRCTWIR